MKGNSFPVWVPCLLVVSFMLVMGCAEPETEAPEAESDSSSESVQEAASLSIGSAFSRGTDQTFSLELFMEFMEEEYPDDFELSFDGGPESFPPPDVFGAVQGGVIDLANVTPVFYEGQVPMGLATVPPDLPPWELRNHGIHDFYDEIHQRHGIKYLARFQPGNKFTCFTQDPVSEPEDLEGMNIRTSPVYRTMLEHFGANPVSMPPGEVYTALERGVVDGFCWPEAGVVDRGWHELVNYRIEPGFFQTQTSLIMNMDSWNQLSSRQQDVLERTVKMIERTAYYYALHRAAEDRETYRDVGIETVSFEGEARERFLNVTYNSFWDLLRSAGDPEEVERFQSLLREAGSEIPLED